MTNKDNNSRTNPSSPIWWLVSALASVFIGSKLIIGMETAPAVLISLSIFLILGWALQKIFGVNAPVTEEAKVEIRQRVEVLFGETTTTTTTTRKKREILGSQRQKQRQLRGQRQKQRQLRSRRQKQKRKRKLTLKNNYIFRITKNSWAKRPN